jgi:UDP-N-acetylglucosamine--N-acetylmuramyl-(pentapeptide) pyrophosphoryl-undecaprenol N-acetylglucosamine transferase
MNEGTRPRVLVAAGGTGGHLFPAAALADALGKRGLAVHLATDRRAIRFGDAFADDAIHVVASATLRARNPVALFQTAAGIGVGLLQARGLIGRLRPAAVIGFGGYPSVPPVLAAVWRGLPTLIHDANAVVGRANRLLAPRVSAIATTFADTFRNEPRLAAKTTVTGNPVRPAVTAAAATPYSAPAEALRVVVFGGSQGARIMSDIVPAAIALLPPQLRAQLHIVQQARDEDVARVQEAYARLATAAEVAPFFSDLPARIAASQLVVARSGASTIAELSAIGRPSILVPLPHAIDQDQFANAGVLERAGGALRLVQEGFTAERLAAELAALAAAPQRLAAMAAAARTVGKIDAAERLADLVLDIAAIAKR